MKLQFSLAIASALLLLPLSGCQTTSKPDAAAEAKPPRIGTPMPYTPAQRTAFLQFGGGGYPTLYDASSSCTFVTPPPPVMEPTPAPTSDSEALTPAGEPVVSADSAKATPPPTAVEPAALSAGSLVFHCTLKSTFEDTSIAYDAAGLRGIHTYLLLPDGTQVQPIETLLDPELIDEPHGALRSYTRKLSLLFPNVPIMMSTPAPGAPANGLRLVLEGHGATFYFEWPPVHPDSVRPEPFLKSETYENVKKGYHKTRNWTRETVHTFD